LISGSFLFAFFLILFFSSDFRNCSTKSSVTPRSSLTDDSKDSLTCPLPVPVFETRYDIGTLLENEGFVSGVELGVQRGYYAAEVLKRWRSCQEYVLVDLWAKQDNYYDGANVDNPIQNEILNTALQSINPWKDKVTVCRNFTTVCALNYLDNHFDWVYVDA